MGSVLRRGVCSSPQSRSLSAAIRKSLLACILKLANIATRKEWQARDKNEPNAVNWDQNSGELPTVEVASLSWRSMNSG